MAPLCHSPRGCQERCCRLPLEDLSSRIGVVIRSKVLSLGPSSSSLSAGRSFCDKRQPQASLLCGSEPGSSGVCVGLPVPRSEPVGRRLSLYNFMVISILFLTLLEDSHSSCLRQRSDRLLPQQEGLPDPDRQPRHDSHLLPGGEEFLAPPGSSPGGGPECHHRTKPLESEWSLDLDSFL